MSALAFDNFGHRFDMFPPIPTRVVGICSPLFFSMLESAEQDKGMQTGAVTHENANRHKAIHENPEEYLTIAETAARLKLSPKTIKNKMAAGIFKKGTHYFSPVGMTPRFKWSAVVLWLEQGELPQSESDLDPIPMARGYRLGESARSQSLLDNGSALDVLSSRQYVWQGVS